MDLKFEINNKYRGCVHMHQYWCDYMLQYWCAYMLWNSKIFYTIVRVKIAVWTPNSTFDLFLTEFRGKFIIIYLLKGSKFEKTSLIFECKGLPISSKQNFIKIIIYLIKKRLPEVTDIFWFYATSAKMLGANIGLINLNLILSYPAF